MYHRLAVLLTTVFLASTAQAVPIEWTFEDVEFINGNGTLTGSFVYDADAPATTDVNITASAGDLFLCADAGCSGLNVADNYAGATFGSATNGAITNGQLRILAFGDGFFNQIVLAFSEPLTNAGGTVDLAFAAQWQCPTNAFCPRNTQSTPFRTAVTGSVTAIGVPEPATLGLLALGLLALRRRS